MDSENDKEKRTIRLPKFLQKEEFCKDFPGGIEGKKCTYGFVFRLYFVICMILSIVLFITMIIYINFFLEEEILTVYDGILIVLFTCSVVGIISSGIFIFGKIYKLWSIILTSIITILPFIIILFLYLI